jgi:hypothetical protein
MRAKPLDDALEVFFLPRKRRHLVQA